MIGRSRTLVAVEVVLLAMWLGAALLLAAVVAPAAFDVLPSRTLAGALVGRILPVLFIGGIAVAVGAFVLDRLVGPVDRYRARSMALVAAAAACAAAQFGLAPRIAALRASMSGPVDALAPADPVRVAFGRLHGLSVGLLAMAMLALAITVALLLVSTFRSPSSRPSSVAT